jgi:uncharacterized protein (TIGR02646 family)
LGVVIPVVAQPEPPAFDLRVRQRGREWIVKNNLDPNAPKPPSVSYPSPAYWAKQPDGYSCLQELYVAYNKICAYTGLRINKDEKTVDHFVAKSRRVGLAFEWSNYRLACFSVNSKKTDFEQILDPFLLEPETFFLILESGEIYVNPSCENKALAQLTLDTLELDAHEYREIRLEHYTDFQNGDISQTYLKKLAPFVYLEALRQGRIPYSP